MRIRNLSLHYPTRKLLSLVDFATGRTSYSALATLVIRDHKGGEYFTGGLATHYSGDMELALVAPSLIELTLGRIITYPVWTEHSKEVGRVCVSNFQEEFLLVLAHELRHVDQFWGLATFDEHWAEMDAEQFAVKVLTEYRLQQRNHIDLARAA